MHDSLIEIRKGLDLLFEPGDVVEIRVPRKHEVQYSATISGFFDNLDLLAQAIHLVNTRYNQTVYVTMNPLKRDWQSINNRVYVGSKAMRQELQEAGLAYEPRMKRSTNWETGVVHHSMRMAEDDDVLFRRWILIDIDAGQPAGTNSSEVEHFNTLNAALAIRDCLTARGFPEPALTDSGNGHHLYVRVNLPNTMESLILIKRFLKALGQKFSGPYSPALVDEGMFNAGRITKAAGTLVFKGPDTLDRPQRYSKVKLKASPAAATLEQITAVANEYIPAEGETIGGNSNPNDDAISNEDLREKVSKLKEGFDFYDIQYGAVKQEDKDIKIPCTCPNASEHTMNGGEMETIAMIRNDGAFSFVCQHAHCQQLRTWKGFKNFLEKQTGKQFNWSNDAPITFNGKVINNPIRSIMVEPAPPNQHLKAVELLKGACNPDCPSNEIQTQAAELGISNRTLRRAYTAAGVEPVRDYYGNMKICSVIH
jgi:hypothetical protein